MMIRTALCLSLALPAAALAECPGPGSLAQGIVIDTMRGTEHFARGEGGAVIVTVRPGNGDFVEIAERAGGILPVVSRIVVDNGEARRASVSTLELDRVAFDALLPLEPGDELRLAGHYRRDNPANEMGLVVSLSVGAIEDVTIGDCGYAALPVTLALERPDGVFTTVLNFIPDLGIAYTASRELPTGETEDDGPTGIRIEGQ